MESHLYIPQPQTCTNDHFVTAKENRQEIDPELKSL